MKHTAPPAYAPSASVFLLILGGVVLVGLLLTTLLTRPVERHKLPSRLSDVRQDLIALHNGEPPCVRWASNEPLTPKTLDAFLNDLETVVVPDLRTVLPVLSQIRVANHERAQSHHPRGPREEFAQVALDRLHALDQARLSMRRDRLEELMPGLQRFEARQRRLKRDKRRAELLTQRLLPQQRQHLASIVDRWRAALASEYAQASVVHRVSVDVTQQRMDLLAHALRSHFSTYGTYPIDIPTVLAHLKKNHPNQMPLVIERGIAQDGALRDGWLRPFEYYRVGPEGYRLTSRGPSESNHTDDIILQGLAGKPAQTIPR